jgi:hypothetical protein
MSILLVSFELKEIPAGTYLLVFIGFNQDP